MLSIRTVTLLQATCVGPVYPDWSSSVPVSDLDSLKQQDCCGRESRENGARRANVSSPPQGVRSLKGTLRPQEDTRIFRIGRVLVDSGFTMIAETLIKIAVALLILTPVMYLVTRFYARYTSGPRRGVIENVDSLMLGQGRFVCVIRAGSRYFLMGINRDTMTVLGELDPQTDRRLAEFLTTSIREEGAPSSFSLILEKAKRQLIRKGGRRE